MSYKEFMRDRYKQCEIVPAWKGFVADDFMRREIIVAPIGFNLLFNFLHGAWLWAKCYRRDCYNFRVKQFRLREQHTKTGSE